MGAILPAHLDGPGVQNYLTEASYLTPNIPTGPEFDIRVVPEPTGVSVIMTTVALLAGRRRKGNEK